MNYSPLPFDTHSTGTTLYGDEPRYQKVVKRVFANISSTFRIQNDGLATFLKRTKRLKQLLFNAPTLIAVVLGWYWTVYHYERTVFYNHITSCDWANWETWPSSATPHRAILIADPQLVDPHTYPGRPWPLSALTFSYTDLYLTRSYSYLQRFLYPDTVFFLGDLFDGGREWSTPHSQSPEERWRGYKQDFWLKEYERFGQIFFNHYRDGQDGVSPRVGQRGRRIIATLPGNHDLGFAGGVQIPVRQRFEAYFGEGNRVDVVGNHSFVSIDALSLSARQEGEHNKQIWGPTFEFLDEVPVRRTRAVERELDSMYGTKGWEGWKHSAVEGKEMSEEKVGHRKGNITDFPTVLLTHVPLYRKPETDCGPLRERGHALLIQGGYQYQNVISEDLSLSLTEKIGKIERVFSGDDHDYCEVIHRAYPSAGGGIKEITVKSMSWAMGVRHPGFLLVSLYNPVDHDGNPLDVPGFEEDKRKTVQSHLCLLPDQLGIFITYAKLFGLSLLVLLVRAIYLVLGGAGLPRSEDDSPLLPITRTRSLSEKKRLDDDSSSSSSHSSHSSRTLSARAPPARTRSVSPGRPLGGYGYGLPASNLRYQPPTVEDAEDAEDEDDWGEKEGRKAFMRDTAKDRAKRKPKGVLGILRVFRDSVATVAAAVLIGYLWIIWNG